MSDLTHDEELVSACSQLLTSTGELGSRVTQRVGAVTSSGLPDTGYSVELSVLKFNPACASEQVYRRFEYIVLPAADGISANIQFKFHIGGALNKVTVPLDRVSDSVYAACTHYIAWITVAVSRLDEVMSHPEMDTDYLKQALLGKVQDLCHPGFQLNTVKPEADCSFRSPFERDSSVDWPFHVHTPSFVPGVSVSGVIYGNGSRGYHVSWYTYSNFQYKLHAVVIQLSLELVVSCGDLKFQADMSSVPQLVRHAFKTYIKDVWYPEYQGALA